MSGERSKRGKAGGSDIQKAVALRYDPEQSAAPRVTAKGQGRLAEEIIERAKEHGVPLAKDPSLVEVLSKLDLNREIPAELYHLTAEILSFVYRTDARAKERKLETND
jgi:flagellar biosynthesis protein